MEKGKEVLQKVKISGGGRCNLTNACFDPAELVKNYPRGGKALLGPFHRFGSKDVVDWFQQRGVRLKAEADGRMFPVTDDSQTIIDCLLREAHRLGIQILTNQNVTAIKAPDSAEENLWRVKTQSEEVFQATKIMVATGGSPRIWQMLEELGHQIAPPVPSLFTFNIKDPRIAGLLGVSVPEAMVSITEEHLQTTGSLLITHWGMSGPAILRLSAVGARLLHSRGYSFELSVNWLGTAKTEAAGESLSTAKAQWAKKMLSGNCPFPNLPGRLWERLTLAADIPRELRWADLSKEKLKNLALQLTDARFQVRGKSAFKEEFVTAGGVLLKEVDFSKFESKIHPGLFLAGEVLDIDAITGGFNFQAAWTGGWHVGGMGNSHA